MPPAERPFSGGGASPPTANLSAEQRHSAIELLAAALGAEDLAAWLPSGLAIVASSTASEFAALVRSAEGQYSPLATFGAAAPLPLDLLADCLDQDVASVRGPWAAAPLGPDSPERALLVLRSPNGDLLGHCRALAPWFADCLEHVQQRERHQRRLRRLEAILAIAQQWNQNPELESLLKQMAEAATRLFQADRASIFLWDKANRVLVGRPALGVDGGELRIPDSRGVVGQVLQSGAPRRVDAAREPREIDRQVDQQLGYHTRNLLCVPLRGRNGELFGAFELINKAAGAFTDDDESGLVELAAHAAVALENAQDRQRLLSASRQMTEQAAAGARLIGRSPAIEALRSIVGRLADTDLAVLIQGENGTGKEVVAQSIHYLSRRRDEPFVAVNCAAIPETLAESELFGHEKGAFTDAREARPGKFEVAAGGTLFLDEIGDLSPGSQAKLLRVLEERVIVRVGGSRPISTHARVVAATNQNLAAMVAQKRFREDLFYRLNVVNLELPPLRDRGNDITLLAEHFLGDFCRKARRKPPQFSEEARRRLLAHPWPGNVRELRNLMERLAYLASGDRIEADELAFILTPGAGSALSAPSLDLPLSEATHRFQQDYIRRVIEACSGNMSQAAEQLGLHRSNLYRKMGQLGMSG